MCVCENSECCRDEQNLGQRVRRSNHEGGALIGQQKPKPRGRDGGSRIEAGEKAKLGESGLAMSILE
jgi:hypothetical protein